jgi:hypothetical protein
MKGRTLIKGLVVIALTSQMAFGGVSEAVKRCWYGAGSYAQQAYGAVKPCLNSCYETSCAVLRPIKDGFVNSAMVACDRSGVADLWVNHHDTCIAGLTLTGMATIYLVYKVYQARKVQKQLEELKGQGYDIKS